MNAKLAAWNTADETAALDAMIACCGARRWATAMVAQRPFESEEKVSAAADRIWSTMDVPDWLEAFACHPRIGERNAAHATAKSKEWSKQEQSATDSTAPDVLERLARGNVLYEQHFGFTYIVCATGKSAEEMLAILERRLNSDRETELLEAAEQQRQITQIRLRKWLASMSGISTHVLDTVMGRPGAGIDVRLETMRGGGWIEVSGSGVPHERVQDSPGGWVEVAAGTTDSDGRCSGLVPNAPAGLYRLTFDTGAYLERRGRTSIYPEISITFICDGEGHYHLPLLLSDNSYTTYRGS